MRLIADTREQAPYSFSGYQVEVVRAALPSGDYSLVGFETRAAIERKTLDDLVGCLTRGRERFERELVRLRPYECKAVVVEASWQDIARGRFRSKMEPHAALQSILTFQVRHGVPFTFAGSRSGGEYCTFWLLSKYLREIHERYRQAVKAGHEAAA
jgi:ERCC4-type nuclease